MFYLLVYNSENYYYLSNVVNNGIFLIKQLWSNQHPPVDKQLRTGLNFHFGDVIEEEDALFYGAIDDRFRLIIVLSGKSHLQIGNMSLQLGEQYSASMALVYLKHPEKFIRESIKGNQFRRISIGISQQWFDDVFADQLQITDYFNALPHLSTTCWQASEQCISIAEHMLTQSIQAHYLQNLYLESNALALIIDAMEASRANIEISQQTSVSQRNKKDKFQVLLDYIQVSAGEKHHISELAKRVNMTVSTLQRQFKQVFGLTVFEYIQQVKLTQSYIIIKTTNKSITTIAGEFGYDSPASFSSAFKRYFNISPSRLRTQTVK